MGKREKNLKKIANEQMQKKVIDCDNLEKIFSKCAEDPMVGIGEPSVVLFQ